jgi:hypothetical protein
MQSWFDVLADLNRLPRVRFVMAEDTGLELSRADRDSKLFSVLSGSGYKLTKRYFTDTYDYRDEDIEDKPEPVLPQIVSAPANPNADQKADPSADKKVSDPKTDAPTKDRSVSDPAGREGKQSSRDARMEDDLHALSDAIYSIAGHVETLDGKVDDLLLADPPEPLVVEKVVEKLVDPVHTPAPDIHLTVNVEASKTATRKTIRRTDDGNFEVEETDG